MNVKRFTGRTPRDALALVRQAFGDDAVVMSTRPCAEGVEVLAMAPESVQQLERVGATAERMATARDRALPAPQRHPVPPPAASLASMVPPARGLRERVEPTFDGPAAGSVEQDVEQMQMSTLSFQDYVRDRMLRRRQAELTAQSEPQAAPARPVVSPIANARARLAAQHHEAAAPIEPTRPPAMAAARAEIPAAAAPFASAAPARPSPVDLPELHRSAPVARAEAPQARVGGVAAAQARRDPPVLREEVARSEAAAAPQAARADQLAMMSELRSMRGLIEQRFGALAFMEKLQRQPRQAQLTQRLLDAGFSPALTRMLAEGLPGDVEEMDWAASVLERNLQTGERENAIEDAGGVYALIGATGVGKTTSAAKLAAAFAARHSASHLGLITLDAYRVAAHEQLRTYGRILGVPVHTAHDRASLEDLLDLLSGKRLVLIDTAGVCQRDARTRELLEMLQHPSIKRLVVISAAAQGETIEDQLSVYATPGCRGTLLSKVDEAVKLGPALDAMIRSRLTVLGVANGQRVPEDWHRLSSHALVQRALRSSAAPAWRLDPAEVNLIFAGMPAAASAAVART